MHAVAKQTTHAGKKTKLIVTSNHSKSNKATVILSAITAQVFLHILLVAFSYIFIKYNIITN